MGWNGKPKIELFSNIKWLSWPFFVTKTISRCKRSPYICDYNTFNVTKTYSIIEIWHIWFFNFSCHKQFSAVSSHGMGLLDLKNIGGMWPHWNMLAFGHKNWFYEIFPFHPTLSDFLDHKKKKMDWLFDPFRQFLGYQNYISVYSQ